MRGIGERDPEVCALLRAPALLFHPCGVVVRTDASRTRLGMLCGNAIPERPPPRADDSAFLQVRQHHFASDAALLAYRRESETGGQW